MTSPFRYNPISISDFNTTIYSTLFKSQSALATSDEPNAVVSHRLSVMFMVLAIGSLMDTRLPAYNVEAEKYHQLARATLFQNNVFDEPNLGVVQALYLMSFYLFFSDRHGTSGGSRWAITGMAARIAQSVSLFLCGCRSERLAQLLLPFLALRSDFVSSIAISLPTDSS
jgi:hypothetical protein